MTDPLSKRHNREAHLLAGLRKGRMPWMKHIEKDGLTKREAMIRLRGIAKPIYEGVELAGRELRVAIELKRLHDLPTASERLAEIRKRGEG